MDKPIVVWVMNNSLSWHIVKMIDVVCKEFTHRGIIIFCSTYKLLLLIKNMYPGKDVDIIRYKKNFSIMLSEYRNLCALVLDTTTDIIHIGNTLIKYKSYS